MYRLHVLRAQCGWRHERGHSLKFIYILRRWIEEDWPFLFSLCWPATISIVTQNTVYYHRDNCGPDLEGFSPKKCKTMKVSCLKLKILAFHKLSSFLRNYTSSSVMQGLTVCCWFSMQLLPFQHTSLNILYWHLLPGQLWPPELINIHQW